MKGSKPTTRGQDARAPVLELIPPHDDAAEDAAVGAMLLDARAAAVAVEMLRPEDFYSPRRQLLFRIISEVFARQEELDEVVIRSEAERSGFLERIGGAEEIGRCMERCPNAAHVERYCKVIRDGAEARAVIRAGADLIALASGEATPEALAEVKDRSLAEKAEELVYQIGRRWTMGDERPRALGEALAEAFTGDKKKPVSTGFADADRLLGGGLWPGEMIVVAGRPSMGKTTFALNVVRRAAARRVPTAIFSIEMSREQIARNFLSAEAGVDGDKLRRGDWSPEEAEVMNAAGKVLKSLPIQIIDTGEPTVAAIRAKCRRMRKQSGLGLIVVDYLQLVRAAGRRDSREQEVAELSREFKGLAREFEIPVVIVAQLNRAPEARADKRPQLSDLRESGAIEQDADVVMLLYRADYYYDEAPKGKSEVNVAKQRNGPVGRVDLSFMSKILRFENYAPEENKR